MSKVVIGPSLEEQEAEARWQLERQKPKPKPWRGREPENTRQTLLLSGLDCPLAQQDLFALIVRRKIDPVCRARAGRRGTPIARLLLS
jgi:hypothetical protein